MTGSTDTHRTPNAVVTGSDSGIGRAVAVSLATDDIDVGITYHADHGGADDTAAEVRAHGTKAAVRRLDLTELPAAGEVVDELAGELGGLDTLVNCSGTGSGQPVIDMDFDLWRRVVSVDLGASSPSRASTSTRPGSVPRRTARPKAARACS